MGLPHLCPHGTIAQGILVCETCLPEERMRMF